VSLVRRVDNRADASGIEVFAMVRSSLARCACLALAAALGAGLGLLAPPRRCDAAPVGDLEVATRCEILGWALDTAVPTPVKVRIRFWSGGELEDAFTLAAQASRVRSDLAGLTGGARPCGFVFQGFGAPASDPVRVELSVQDGSTGAWVCVATRTLPGATAPAFSAALEKDPEIVVDWSAPTGDVTCTATVIETVPAGAASPACEYRVEVWGTRVASRIASQPTGSPPAPGVTTAAHEVVTALALAAEAGIDAIASGTGTLLISVWAVVDPTDPGKDVLVGASEVPLP
jgi:hypothetical protein